MSKARIAGFAPRCVFPLVVGRPAGMSVWTRCTLVQLAGFTGDVTSCAVCSSFSSGPDARHHGWYEPEGPFSSSWFDSGFMFMSFYGGVGCFTDFLRKGGTRTLKSVRTWHADIFSMAPRIWHPLVRCRSGVQDYGFFWETTSGNVPVFSAMLGSTLDSYLRQSTVLSYSPQCLGRQWIQFASVYGARVAVQTVLPVWRWTSLCFAATSSSCLS